MGLFDRAKRKPPPVRETESVDFAGWAEWEAPHRAIKGESHYRNNLLELAGPPTEDGYLAPVSVVLRREPQNAYDPNAIRAEIDGLLVGHVAKEAAAELAPLMDRMECTECMVAGVIRGGSSTASDLGVHLWPRRQLSPGPILDALEATQVAAWPPRVIGTSQEALLVRSEHSEPVDRYYQNLKRIERAWNKLAFDEAIKLCHESISLIPAVLNWSRSISGGEVRIRSIPVIENLCRAYEARADQEALQSLREEVARMGSDVTPWLEDIDDAIERAQIAQRIYELVRRSPGFLQRNLSKEIPGAKGRASTLCYWADQMGLLHRQKSGATYALFVTGNTP